MTVLPMEGLRSSALVRDLDAHAAALGAAAPTRLVIRCPVASSFQTESRLAALDDALFLDAKASDVEGWDIQEAIVHAVRALGVSQVLVCGHAHADHRRPTSKDPERGRGEGDFMARMAHRVARHREGLDAAKQDVRKAVAGLEALVGEYAAVFGAVEIAQSGCLLFYDAVDDAFRAAD